MSIKEIWAPGALAALFLAIPLLRTFIGRLRALEGVAWLPFVALCILAGIFPAYGFRIEIIPLLAFALLFNLSSLLSFVAAKASRPTDSFEEERPFRAIAAMALLAAATVPMFAFAPQVYTRQARDAGPTASLAVPGGLPGADYVLRIYGPALASRPIVFLVPPEIGSAASVELVSESLQEKGFTVVTYFRRDRDTFLIDENGRRRAFPARLMRHWRASRRAADFASANARGRALESERRADVEFLLPRLPALLGAEGPEALPPILFVGYGAGGSALALMAGEDGFLAQHSDALGVIAVGSRLWSSYVSELRAIEPLTDAGAMARLRTNIANWLDGRRALRVSRDGPLPAAGLPTLYLVSGRALDGGRRQRSAYQAVFDALRYGYGQIALAAIEGAGPLDYQDYPLTQPALSFFLRGARGAERSADPIGDTAGIIGNFASFLLERRQAGQDGPGLNGPPEGHAADGAGPPGGAGAAVAAADDGDAEGAEQEAPASQGITIPPRRAIQGALRVESRGMPDFQL